MVWEQEEGPELDAASALDALAEEGDEGESEAAEPESVTPPGRLPAGRQTKFPAVTFPSPQCSVPSST